jgi:hypothetical protein
MLVIDGVSHQAVGFVPEEDIKRWVHIIKCEIIRSDMDIDDGINLGIPQFGNRTNEPNWESCVLEFIRYLWIICE